MHINNSCFFFLCRLQNKFSYQKNKIFIRHWINLYLLKMCLILPIENYNKYIWKIDVDEMRNPSINYMKDYQQDIHSPKQYLNFDNLLTVVWSYMKYLFVSNFYIKFCFLYKHISSIWYLFFWQFWIIVIF